MAVMRACGSLAISTLVKNTGAKREPVWSRDQPQRTTNYRSQCANREDQRPLHVFGRPILPYKAQAIPKGEREKDLEDLPSKESNDEADDDSRPTRTEAPRAKYSKCWKPYRPNSAIAEQSANEGGYVNPVPLFRVWKHADCVYGRRYRHPQGRDKEGQNGSVATKKLHSAV
jgi:hypothetical protein